MRCLLSVDVRLEVLELSGHLRVDCNLMLDLRNMSGLTCFASTSFFGEGMIRGRRRLFHVLKKLLKKLNNV